MAQAAPQESKVYIEDKTCTVCRTNPVNVILTPCNHMSCNMCVKRVDKCPKCRAQVVKTINTTEAMLKSDKYEVLENQIEQLNNSDVQDVDTNLFDTIVGVISQMMKEASCKSQLKRSAFIWNQVLDGATTGQLLKQPDRNSISDVLLAKYSEVAKEKNLMESLLMSAIFQNRVHVIDTLLASPDINLNYRNDDGYSLLDAAVMCGHFKLVKRLVMKGAELSHEAPHNPVHLALALRNANIAGFLMQKNPKLANRLFALFEEEDD